MQPICRVGDKVQGYCDGPGHETHRSFIGTWTQGSGVCFADNLGVIRVGDLGITDCGHQFRASTGSGWSTADGLAIHRVDDEVIVIPGGYGWSITGSGTCSSE